MRARYDLAVIGAGPAGLATAALADKLGLRVVLLDEQPSPGGQLYRTIEASPLSDGGMPGGEYDAGRALVEQLRETQVDYLESAAVWQVSPELEIAYTRSGTASLIEARQVVLATGVMERPFPIPGWTLPGVMTAGAAQVLLKSAGLAAVGAVFAGCGPLLYLTAWQYGQAGVPIRAVLDTTPRANYLRAALRLPRALGAYHHLTNRMAMVRDLRRRGVRIITGVRALRAMGTERLRSVQYRRHGTWRKIESEVLFLHQGLVPDMNLAAAAGCAHDWSDNHLCWRPRLDPWGETTVAGIAMAGDSGSIGGGSPAMQGQLTALGAAGRLGRLDNSERDRRAATIREQLRSNQSVRPFLDWLYRPARGFRVPKDDTVVVCRCEELSLGDIRRALEIGCPGPNQLKSFVRCGMGPCQGRLCGLTVSEIIAAARGVPVAEVGHFRPRPPVKPLRLDELAGLEEQHHRS